MKVAIIKSTNEAMHNLIVDTLNDINDNIEIIEIDETNLDIIADGVLATSVRDIEMLDQMMTHNDYGMLITGGKIVNGVVPSTQQHVLKYSKKILWRDKIHFKKVLNEMYKVLKGKR